MKSIRNLFKSLAYCRSDSSQTLSPLHLQAACQAPAPGVLASLNPVGADGWLGCGDRQWRLLTRHDKLLHGVASAATDAPGPHARTATPLSLHREDSGREAAVSEDEQDGLPLRDALAAWFIEPGDAAAIEAWLAVSPEGRLGYLDWEHSRRGAHFAAPRYYKQDGRLAEAPRDVLPIHEAAFQAAKAAAATATAQLLGGAFQLIFRRNLPGVAVEVLPAEMWQDLTVEAGLDINGLLCKIQRGSGVSGAFASDWRHGSLSVRPKSADLQVRLQTASLDPARTDALEAAPDADAASPVVSKVRQPLRPNDALIAELCDRVAKGDYKSANEAAAANLDRWKGGGGEETKRTTLGKAIRSRLTELGFQVGRK